MRRAVDLFQLDQWDAASTYVTRYWQARSVPEPSFISVATSRWKIVVVRQRGRSEVVVRGPETRATEVDIPDDAEFFGIDFSLGTYMPGLPLPRIVDQAVTLSRSHGDAVWIDGDQWEVPVLGNADVFVDRLVRRGLVAYDPVAAEAVEGVATGYSARTLERRITRASGLTRGTIRQIARAERAVEALVRGVSPAEVAGLAGYADQAHLGRSLRRFVGLTPAQIAASSGTA